MCDCKEFSWCRYESAYLEVGEVNLFILCNELNIIVVDIMHKWNPVVFHSFKHNPLFVLSSFESTWFWQSLFVTPSETYCRIPQMLWISPQWNEKQHSCLVSPWLNKPWWGAWYMILASIFYYVTKWREAILVSCVYINVLYVLKGNLIVNWVQEFQFLETDE